MSEFEYLTKTAVQLESNNFIEMSIYVIRYMYSSHVQINIGR